MKFRRLEASNDSEEKIQFKNLTELKEKIKRMKNKPLNIFADFDGTLTPIHFNGKKCSDTFFVFKEVSYIITLDFIDFRRC